MIPYQFIDRNLRIRGQVLPQTLNILREEYRGQHLTLSVHVFQKCPSAHHPAHAFVSREDGIKYFVAVDLRDKIHHSLPPSVHTFMSSMYPSRSRTVSGATFSCFATRKHLLKSPSL